MPLKRSLAAISIVAIMALVGCSSDDEGSGEPDASAGAEAGMPEADLEDVPEVVAEVNGEEISRDEFVRNYEGQLQQTAMQQMQQGTGEEIDQDELKQQVAQLLVDNRLLTQAATDAQIEPTEEDIDAALEDFAAQNGMSSADEVVAALGEQGVSEEEVRADAAAQFQVSTFVENEADISEPSEEELRQQYDAMVEQQEAADEQQGGEIPPFEDVRDQLAEQSVMQQQSEAVEGIVESLREEAKVTVNL